MQCEVIFSNNPKTILDYTKNVLTCDIHTRFRTKRILTNNGAEKVYGLDDILAESIDGSGYNEDYGLLGSNKATEDSVKLFPNNCQPIVDNIQAKLKEEQVKQLKSWFMEMGHSKTQSVKFGNLRIQSYHLLTRRT